MWKVSQSEQSKDVFISLLVLLKLKSIRSVANWVRSSRSESFILYFMFCEYLINNLNHFRKKIQFEFTYVLNGNLNWCDDNFSCTFLNERQGKGTYNFQVTVILYFIQTALPKSIAITQWNILNLLSWRQLFHFLLNYPRNCKSIYVKCFPFVFETLDRCGWPKKKS